MPIVEAIRKLYVTNVFSLARVEKMFQDGYISEDEKRFILTGSYDVVEEGASNESDAGTGENAVKE